MTTKEQVLKLLNNNIGTFLSGQDIADQIFVTRASVWKAIKSLEKDGHNIEAVTNRGYRLKSPADIIDVSLIKNDLCKEWKDIKIIHYTEIDSTNDEAKRLANSSDEDLIIIADHQTNGHGRRGRNFFSPDNTGLYFSIVLHGNKIPDSLAGITAIAAVSVATAIDSTIFNKEDTTKIKWVNDIFYNNKKVCGILSEACTYMEDADNNYIIIGFGINIYEPLAGFPKELKNTAGYLFPNHMSRNSNIEHKAFRNSLVSSITNNLLYYFNNKRKCLSLYRSKSCLIGSYIKINNFSAKKDIPKYAKVLGINSNYHLLIEYDNGDKDELSSGEVSVVKY